MFSYVCKRIQDTGIIANVAKLFFFLSTYFYFLSLEHILGYLLCLPIICFERSSREDTEFCVPGTESCSE